jgi:hypothetical protein
MGLAGQAEFAAQGTMLPVTGARLPHENRRKTGVFGLARASH